MNGEKLVSEALTPQFGEGPPATTIVAGEPVLPGAFTWRGRVYPVLRVLGSGKGLGPCTHGSGECYVRKHWYRIESADGVVLRVYFERRGRPGARMTRRWWLYAIAYPATACGTHRDSGVADP